MNPIFREAAETARLGWLMGLMTALFLGCFALWIWWAFAPSRRARMEEASRMPFSDGGDS
jgi:cbb3-type cytochrome oxidase subunit 3